MNLKFNPFQAGDVDPHTHLMLLMRVLTRALDIPPRTAMFLKELLYGLFAAFGIFQGQRDLWPTPFDLLPRIEADHRAPTAVREALRDRFVTLCLGLGVMAAYRKAWTVAQLQAHSLVLELCAVSELVKQVLVQTLIFGLFNHTYASGLIDSPPRTLVFLDDCLPFLDTDQQGASAGFGGLAEAASIARGAGVCIGISGQTSICIPRPLSANLTFRMWGQVNAQEDWHRLQADLNLGPEQVDYLRLNLKPRRFVAQAASSPDWRKPFICEVPRVDLGQPVSDAEVDDTARALDYIPVVEAPEFKNWTPVPQVELQSSQATTPTVLPEADRRLLRAVIDNPGQPSSNYARLAKLSGARATEIRRRLVGAGLLKEHTLATGGRGRAAIILEPTEAGSDALKTGGEV